MNVDVIKYLKRNLQPDPDIDLTDEVLEYVAQLENDKKSLDKIRAARRRHEKTARRKETRKAYKPIRNQRAIEKYHREHPNAKYRTKEQTNDKTRL